MNSDVDELENELRRMRPRSLPAPLVGRVAAELDKKPDEGRGILASWRAWILPAMAAAALAVAVTSIPFFVRESGEEPGAGKAAAPTTMTQAETYSRLHPVRATNVLYDAVNEGIVYLEDNTPARRMRFSYLDTITWEDPRSGTSLQRSVPREEIYFIPVTAN